MRLFTNKRVRDIFLQLTEGSVTQNALAQEMNVSSRTIRNDLKEVGEVLAAYGNSLSIDRKKGVSIQIQDSAGMDKLLALSQAPWKETRTASERRRALLSALLSDNKGICLATLESEWFISIYSLRNDITLLKRHFSLYEITIVTEGNDKFTLSGTESALRRCLYDHLLNAKECDDEYGVIFGSSRPISEIKNNLSQYLSQNAIMFSDVNLRFFSLICGIISERISRGNWLFDYVFTDCEPRWRPIAKEIITLLINDDDISIPASEIDYMAMNLAAFCSALSDDTQKISPYAAEQAMMNHFLSYINTAWFFEIKYDDIALNSLLSHIKALRIRVNNGIAIINPLIEQIKRHYPLMFEMTMAAFSELDHFFTGKITDDEIGYLVMHIGAMLDAPDAKGIIDKTRVLVVSDQGSASARIACHKIVKMYPEIEIANTLSVEQYNLLDVIEQDIVISLAHIIEKNKRVIKVSPLPERWQLDSIKYHLRARDRLPETMLNYFSESHFFIFNGNEYSKDQVINLLSEHLKKQGRVDEHYLKSVQEREARSSTLLDDKIAIPHPLGLVALSTMVTVAIFPDGIEWDPGKSVKLVFMLAISENAFIDSMVIYDYLTNILDNDVIERLSQCESYIEFISISRNYFL